MANEFIKHLQKKRKSFVESMRENNFENGIKNLLTQLYPENAHFIYELLQNAEDTGANNVRFELNQEKLIFSHDGRGFNEKDLEGITSIGEGTKKDDINQIGKFGVGFKAVFAYTNTPIIHSDLFNFKIVDLVIPYEIEQDKTNGMTIMEFPFDSEKKREIAYKEIDFGLKNLHDNTLLFLNNIKKIEIIIDKNTNIIERKENGNNIVIIANNKTSHWIRFKKNIEGSKTLFTSIAFSYDINKNEIKPLKKGEVSVYFPAESATSNLKFHIHAPFASTVARDSIINNDENIDLIKQISSLLCESILKLKDENLYNLDFINCLPIDDDNLSEFYKPIQNKLIEFFLENEIIPTYVGKFVYPKYAIKANKKIRDVFNTEFLLLLEEFQNIEELYYCKNSTLNNNRIDKFLHKLNIYELEEENLVGEIINLNNKPHNPDSFDEIYKYLKRRDVFWFSKLYIFLHDYFQKSDWINYQYGLLKCRKELMYLVKLDCDTYFNYDEKPCFFKANVIPKNTNLLFVDELTYVVNDKQKSEKPKLFLKSLDVKELNLKEELLVLLNEYYTGKHRWVLKIKKNINLHLKHWRKIISFYETENKECIEILKKYKIFATKSLELANEKNLLKAPPFFSEDETYLLGYKNFDFLCNDIYLNFNEKELDLFKEILSQIDFKGRLVLKKERITRNTKHPNHSHITRSYRRYETNNSDYEKDSDYLIERFDFFVNKPSLEKSSFLCVEINVLDSKYLTAIYQRNSREYADSDSSYLVYQLKNNNWLPTKEFEFKKPNEIFLDELHPNFEKYVDSKFFKLIEFGKEEEAIKIEIPIDQEVFDKTDGKFKNLDDVIEKNEELQNKLKETENELKEKEEKIKLLEAKQNKARSEKTNEPKSLIESIRLYNKVYFDDNQKIKPLSSEIVKIENKYVNAVTSKLREAISKSKNERLKRHTNVSFKTGVKETRAFLYKQYKGICQICQFTFVNVANRKNHYNVLDLFDNKITKAGIYFINPGTSICLCSNCHSAVKFGEFNADFIEIIDTIKIKNLQSFSKYFQDDDFLCENKPDAYSLFDSDFYKLPITLLGEKKHIHYNEEHILHFITVLEMNIQGFN